MKYTIFDGGYYYEGKGKVKRRRLSSKDRVQIRECLAAGELPESVAERLGFTLAEVNRAAVRPDIDGGRLNLSAGDIKAIGLLYLDGQSVDNIGESYGLSKTTVAAYLKIYGYKVRDQADIDRAKELYRKGNTIDYIAAYLDYQPEAIRSWVKTGGERRPVRKRKTQAEDLTG